MNPALRLVGNSIPSEYKKAPFRALFFHMHGFVYLMKSPTVSMPKPRSRTLRRIKKTKNIARVK